MVLLRTKQAAKLEAHQGLINVPVIDRLNSGYPQDLSSCFPCSKSLLTPSQCMHQSQTVDITVTQTEVLSHLIYNIRVMQDLR